MTAKPIRQEKKPTAAQLERRLRNALIVVERTSDGSEVFFGDKWLRLYVNNDFATVGTMFHTHVFHRIVASGISRPYLYIKRMIEMALENDCVVKDAKGNPTRSYKKMMDVLKEKQDDTEYNIAWIVDKWLNNIFAPLYGLGENETDAFLLYETYMHNIARLHVILDEKKEDMTNKQFVEAVLAREKEYTDTMTEMVVFKALSDEERAQQIVEAMQAEM